MIKVGQIYKVPYLGGKVVITWIRADKTEFHMVRDDGFFLSSKDNEMDKDSVLLAEYPTWQEAVNSKEFKDIYKTTREIELEKKLEIAVKALEKYADPYKWDNCIVKFIVYDQQEIINNGCFTSNGFETAQEALAKISEVEK